MTKIIYCKVLLIIFVVTGTGCVSIGTYEKKLRKLNELEQNKRLLEEKVNLLQTENTQLQASLAEKGIEKEKLEGKISDVRSTYDELIDRLKEDIAQGNVGVDQTADGLTITVLDKVLFQSGQANLQITGKRVLMDVAKALGKVQDRLIRVEGHTDNLPIAANLKTRFPTNWELSAGRAAAVVRFLQEKGQVDPNLLVLTAYAEYRPLQDNNTPQGRHQNRRVGIKLLPK